MERIGLVTFLILLVVTLLALVGVAVVGLSATPGLWFPLFVGAILIGPPLAFGGGWLAILWGSREPVEMVKIGVALIAHCFTAALLAFANTPLILTAALICTIVADVTVIEELLDREEPRLA